MRQHFHALRTFARRNPYAVLVGIAMVIVTSLAAIETSGMLPLEGQATPMYGPTPTRSVRIKKTTRKKPLVRRIIRRAASSSSRMR